MPGYQGLSITGRCGRVEWEKSERVIVPPPVPEGRISAGWRGLYFSPATWDGSDLFVPDDGSTYVIVTAAVRAAIEDARLTNLEFTRLTEFQRIWNRTPDGEIIFGPPNAATSGYPDTCAGSGAQARQGVADSAKRG